MPPRSQSRAKATAEEHGKPKYPYTTKPGTLRKLLSLIPERPRPPKFTGKVLKSWGFTDSNDASAIRVLKNVGLLSETGETGDMYKGFMDRSQGPAVLGTLVRDTYPELFTTVKDPARASSEDVTRFFNVNSGGSPKTIEYQVQSFRALADSSRFDAGERAPKSGETGSETPSAGSGRIPGGDGHAALHIDLHVHLPENKTLLDYAGIFASIAEHILGRKP